MDMTEAIAEAGRWGLRIRGTLGDIDPLNKAPFKRARRRVQKGPLQGVSLVLPRRDVHFQQERGRQQTVDRSFTMLEKHVLYEQAGTRLSSSHTYAHNQSTNGTCIGTCAAMLR